MSVASVSAGSRLELGKVVADTFAVIQRNLTLFIVGGALMIGIPDVLSALVGLGFKLGGGVGVGIVFPSVGIGLIALVFNLTFQAALFYATDRDFNGAPASLGEMLPVGFRQAIPFLGLLILVGLAFYIGFLLFVVPGILLLLRWSVAGPALVIEGQGVMKAMGRSAVLTKDRRGAISLLYLLVFIILGVFEGVLIALVGGFAGLAAMTTGASPATIIISLIVTPIFTIAFAVIGAVLSATLYHHLRVSREGAASETVAEVFA